MYSVPPIYRKKSMATMSLIFLVQARLSVKSVRLRFRLHILQIVFCMYFAPHANVMCVYFSSAFTSEFSGET